MPKEQDLAWLAGFIDGEGSIIISRYKAKDGRIKLCPIIDITNTCQATILHCKKILDSLDTSYHIQFKKKQGKKNQDSYSLVTRNNQYIYKTITYLLPYLVTKASQAEMTLEFVVKKLDYKPESSSTT